ncbi:MAG: glycosyltransferase [Fimbriimonadales bacterium]|nr:glycosyltransferase [Fimbriimonadales bacterium]
MAIAKPLRVAHVLPALQTGGAERLAVNLCIYHTARTEPACLIYDPPSGTHYERQLEQAQIPLLSAHKRRAYDLGVFVRLLRLLRGLKLDVAHLHISGINYLFPLLPLLRLPSVYTVHSIAERDLHARCGGRLVQYLAFRYRLGGVQPVAISEQVRVSFQQLYGWGELPVIWNGIPVDEFAPSPERRTHWRTREGFTESEILIVSVAGFRPPKNLSLLVRAFARLPLAEARLLLVGSGEQEMQVRALAQELRVTTRVHFLGVRSDIPELLNACDLFVLSSDWEGTPMAIMEAMASGLPVVSTAVGGVPELVQHGTTGLLVPKGDEAALVDALCQLGSDAARRQAMGDAARRFAQKHFDVRKTVDAYEQLYAQIAHR